MGSDIALQPLNLLIDGTHLEPQARQIWVEAGRVGYGSTEAHALCAGEARRVPYSQLLQSDQQLHYNQGYGNRRQIGITSGAK